MQSTNGHKQEHRAISDGWIGFRAGWGWGWGLWVSQDMEKPYRQMVLQAYTCTHTPLKQMHNSHTCLCKSWWSCLGDAIQRHCCWKWDRNVQDDTEGGKESWQDERTNVWSPGNKKTTLDFWECEICDRKSLGFVWIRAAAGLSSCKNTYHRKTPAAFLVSVGLLTGTSAGKHRRGLSPDAALCIYCGTKRVNRVAIEVLVFARWLRCCFSCIQPTAMSYAAFRFLPVGWEDSHRVHRYLSSTWKAGAGGQFSSDWSMRL